MKRTCLVSAICLLFLAPGRAMSPQGQQATIGFLQKLQQRDGGFLTGPELLGKQAHSSLRATTTALRALRYLGSSPKDKAGCGQFVRACFIPQTGGFADHPGGTADVHSTAAGLMGVVELSLPVSDYQQAVLYLEESAKNFEEIRIAAAAFESIRQKSRQSNAWLMVIDQAKLHPSRPDALARATGSEVVTLLRLGGNAPDAQKIAQVMREGQRQDGGFGKEGSAGSDLESSYRVVRAFVMLRRRPDVQGCRKFVESCRNADGGYGIEPGKPSSAPTTYFATTILHWLQDMER